ncbi:MAG: nitroreductase family protein [candidate division KSB1 bacterium]|nr:nitroreductase family protein [candidate division KSB1 bacterium]
MSSINSKFLLITFILLYLIPPISTAQDIALPPPQKTGGMALMEAFNNRKSTREFSDKEIPLQVLSDLLWAAYGYNRPQQKMRTVPSAWNIQNMSVYVARADGLFLYDAQNNSLKRILNEDIRAKCGAQSFVASVPVNLVYVADLSMMSAAGDRANFYSTVHAGFVAQNVYLFCAAFNLATVVRDLIDRDALRVAMKLEADQEIILAQSVGYPKGASSINMRNDEGKNVEGYWLAQNFPNPFNLETNIKFKLAEDAQVIIAIFDLKGKKIRTILNDRQQSGEYTLTWDGLNDAGERVSSGVYFYQLEADNDTDQLKQTQKMLLLK